MSSSVENHQPYSSEPEEQTKRCFFGNNVPELYFKAKGSFNF